MFVSSCLLIALPALGKNGTNVEDNHSAIIKVYDSPVGIQSNFKRGKCSILSNIIPMSEYKIPLGESIGIKVIGDDDIIVHCNGKKGITISREEYVITSTLEKEAGHTGVKSEKVRDITNPDDYKSKRVPVKVNPFKGKWDKSS